MPSPEKTPGGKDIVYVIDRGGNVIMTRHVSEGQNSRDPRQLGIELQAETLNSGLKPDPSPCDEPI